MFVPSVTGAYAQADLKVRLYGSTGGTYVSV
jgi:hypothetical protein